MRNGRFEILVNALCPTDKAHRTHPKTVFVQGPVGGGDHRWMAGQTQVIIRTAVDDDAAVIQGYFGALGRNQDAFLFEKTLIAQVLKFFLELGSQAFVIRLHDEKIRLL